MVPSQGQVHKSDVLEGDGADPYLPPTLLETPSHFFNQDILGIRVIDSPLGLGGGLGTGAGPRLADLEAVSGFLI